MTDMCRTCGIREAMDGAYECAECFSDMEGIPLKEVKRTEAERMAGTLEI